MTAFNVFIIIIIIIIIITTKYTTNISVCASACTCAQGARAFFTALVSMTFYLTLEKVWSFKLLATAWYNQQPLLVKLVTMQVRAACPSVFPSSYPPPPSMHPLTRAIRAQSSRCRVRPSKRMCCAQDPSRVAGLPGRRGRSA